MQESAELALLIMFSFFFLCGLLVVIYNIVDNQNQRKFELEKLKITTSKRYVVVPMALNLINELTNNTSQISSETSARLIETLNKIIGIIQSDTNDQDQLNGPLRDLSDILNTANVGADITLKLQQIIDWISSNQ